MRTATAMFLAALAATACGGIDEETKSQPDYVTVQHILLGFREARGFLGFQPPGRVVPEGTRADAEARLKKVEPLARAGGDFAALIREYSDDPITDRSAPGVYRMANRGRPERAGYVERKGMAASFGNVAFTLKVGEIGVAAYDAKDSPYGWHIIKRLE